MDINGKWESVSTNYKDDIERVRLEFDAFQVDIHIKYNSRDFVVSGKTTYSYQETKDKKKLYFDFMPTGKDEFVVVQKDRNHLALKDSQDNTYEFKKLLPE